MSRECPLPKDWSRVKCTNCSKFGHGAKRCPEAEVTGDSYGGGSNDWDAPTNSGAATSAWAGDDSGSGEGTGESWADQATTEAHW